MLGVGILKNVEIYKDNSIIQQRGRKTLKFLLNFFTVFSQCGSYVFTAILVTWFHLLWILFNVIKIALKIICHDCILSSHKGLIFYLIILLLLSVLKVYNSEYEGWSKWPCSFLYCWGGFEEGGVTRSHFSFRRIILGILWQIDERNERFEAEGKGS